MLKFFNKDFKIVENWKKFFIASCSIWLVAVLVISIFGLKLGVDFTGGYSLEIKYADLTEENLEETYNNVRNVVENMKNDNGDNYNIKINSYQMQKSESGDPSLVIRFRAIGDDEYMETEIIKIKEKLQEAIFDPANDLNARVIYGDTITGTISAEILLSAFCALGLVLTLMLVYIMFRFQLASGIAAICSLLHDVIIMISFMAFTRMEVNSTFIAAVITIIGYSINNSLVIFDRVRDYMKDPLMAKLPVNTIVNSALKKSLIRTFNATITTLMTIIVLIIVGVSSVKLFALPIVIGLISGFYSSFCIAPSIFALILNRSKKKAPVKKAVGAIKSKA